MTELALIGTILLILGFFGYREREHAKEKHDLMLAAMSQTVDEYLDVKRVDRSIESPKELDPIDPVVSMEELSDGEFLKYVMESQTVKGDKNN